MDPNTTLIVNEIQNLSGRIEALPSKSDVRLAVIDGIKEHEQNCKGPKQARENTEKLSLIGRARSSITPAARKIPKWAQAMIGIISALGAAGAAVAAAL